MRSLPAPALVALALLGGSLVSDARADAEWKRVAEHDGVVVERRSVAGSSFYEYRGTAHCTLPVARVASALWTDRATGKFTKKYRGQHKVLQESPSERLIYEQIATPVISDRDYTVHMRRRTEAGTGIFHYDFWAENDKGPPPVPGFVRVRAIRGSWVITPAADGGSDIVYMNFSEPGGSIPAFLVHGSQRDSTREVLEEVMDWARAHP